jgi:hypothetical protein
MGSTREFLRDGFGGMQVLITAPFAPLPTTGEFLRDGFAFDPALSTWRKLKPPPRAIVGSPGPALELTSRAELTSPSKLGARNAMLFLPGDDGAHFGEQAVRPDCD